MTGIHPSYLNVIYRILHALLDLREINLSSRAFTFTFLLLLLDLFRFLLSYLRIRELEHRLLRHAVVAAA